MLWSSRFPIQWIETKPRFTCIKLPKVYFCRYIFVKFDLLNMIFLFCLFVCIVTLSLVVLWFFIHLFSCIMYKAIRQWFRYSRVKYNNRYFLLAATRSTTIKFSYTKMKQTTTISCHGGNHTINKQYLSLFPFSKYNFMIFQ